jgi:hypothetical protein
MTFPREPAVSSDTVRAALVSAVIVRHTVRDFLTNRKHSTTHHMRAPELPTTSFPHK